MKFKVGDKIKKKSSGITAEIVSLEKNSRNRNYYKIYYDAYGSAELSEEWENLFELIELNKHPHTKIFL